MKLVRLGLLAGVVSTFMLSAHAQTNLQVTYSNNGIQRVTYNGVLLEDTDTNAGDIFHIGHMKVTDLAGNVLSGGQYDWGEVNNGRSWNPFTHAWTYSFNWGSVIVQFVQNGNSLDMNVTVQNFAGSGVVVDGAVIYPFVLRFPQLPNGFVDSSWEQLAFNTTGPSVTLADFGSGEVASVVTDAFKPLYSGFEPAGAPNAYFPIISGTGLDTMATFFPHNDRPVTPGQTDSYTVSLRFAASGTPAATLAADAYQTWARTWPSQLNWSDRRIIGTAYLASAGDGPATLSAGFANNPRRYFNDGNAADFDVNTSDGLARFQTRILQQASNNVSNLQRMNAQGIITWDIEGQQFPHTTSYVCSPDQIAQIAPEMESTITDPSSPYNGMKLDDAYFKVMRDAGFRVGVCIRPQHFTLYGNGTAEQVSLPADQIVGELTSKMKYAHDRWGVTLFYVDSSVDANGGALDPAIFQQVAANLPDSLIMPEESTPKYYAYTAPFQSFIFHTDLGTPAEIYNYYPRAFSVNLVNDVDPAKLGQYRSQLTDAVRHGDILMLHADYWHDNNATAVQIYSDAGYTGPINTTPTPVIVPTTPTTDPAPSTDPMPTTDPAPTTPDPTPTPTAADPTPSTETNPPVVITNVAGGNQLSGVFFVAAQIQGTLDSAGTYLMVDGVRVNSWSFTVGGGLYIYWLDTTQFSNGSHVLQVWAHNTNNEALLSSTVTATFTN